MYNKINGVHFMNKTINVIPHDKCTGCGACYNKCPVDAIVMEYDDEGFIYPKITDSCINCGLCQNVCPVQYPLKLHKSPASYAVWASDEIRLKSSSGGMFTLLADYILQHKGVVCGAAYTKDFQQVHHIWADSEEGLVPLRGSKYVQSDTELTYRETKAHLEQDRLVLYTGCPCQIAGLYNYLGKDYPNLYTADLVCHGSNSIKAYQSFIKEFSGNQEIQKVDFRDKKYYTWSTPTVVYLKNGDVKKASWNESFWNKGFLEGVINRQCCYSCPYARTERIADITMADCWQIHRYNSTFDDRKGTSLVLVNTIKGQNLFGKICPHMKLCESIPLDCVTPYNGQLRAPARPHPSRKFFFSHLDKLGYHKALWYGRGMRFDVGIVGWWFASNYGSSLTYYALGSVLEKMGKQVLMIPIAKTNGTPWEPEIQFTVDFISKYFHVGQTRAYDKMHEFNKFCDTFMLGSDQMWTGDSTDLVGYTFFLDFVDRDKKKIAFSTSFGHGDFYAPEEVIATAADYLRRFDAISVREKSGIDICKERFSIEADQIFDPVFLCDKQDYDRLAENVNDPLPEKYLLCYILDPTAEKEAAAKAIAEHEHLKILTILGLKEYHYAKEKWHTGEVLPQITSEQFLFYMKHCSYLLTDSHHGTCFGIIYQKPYAALVNPQRGATRFETVAKALGLTERLFENANDIISSGRPYKPIDYIQVSHCIELEKARAKSWLEKAFECPTQLGEETIYTIKADYTRRVLGLTHKINNLENKINQQNEQNRNEIVELHKSIEEILRFENLPRKMQKSEDFSTKKNTKKSVEKLKNKLLHIMFDR